MENNKMVLIISMMIFSLLISCSDDNQKEDECNFNHTAYITSVMSPNKGVVNETINIKVDFQVSNGCGQFGKFIETGNNNEKNITIEATYKGCICTDNLPIRMVNYEFIAKTPGIYKLNFKSSSKEFFTVNLIIN